MSEKTEFGPSQSQIDLALILMAFERGGSVKCENIERAVKVADIHHELLNALIGCEKWMSEHGCVPPEQLIALKVIEKAKAIYS